MARTNARMALMLAIGALQRNAGADQRVTATADIAGGAGGIRAVAGAEPLNDKVVGGTSTTGPSKGLSKVQLGTRNWTGVWRNKENPNLIYYKTPIPEFLQWLVSGADLPSTDVTPGSGNVAVSENGSVGDDTTAVVLVGKNTAGEQTGAADSYVAAPLVPIVGMSRGNTKVTVGRYAWWVGDEGVKAKINLTTSYDSDAVATNKIFSTQRSGWDALANFQNYPLPGRDKSLVGLATTGQAALLGLPSDAKGQAFQSATADSFGLLTDVLQGGLRYDLTSSLRSGLTPSSDSAILNAGSNSSNIINQKMVPSVSGIANMKGPKWNRLKEFSELGDTLSSGSLKVKVAATVSDYAIAPVIVDFRMLLGAKVVPTGATNEYYVQPCAKIAVTLANPYSYPLRWDGLDLQLTNSFPNNGVRVSCVYDASGQPAYIPKTDSDPAVFNKALFRINSSTLPPGAAVAYSMSGPTVRTVGTGANQVVVPLSPVSNTIDKFENAVFLENQDKNTIAANKSLHLDVREAGITSMFDVELRPQGSTQILRKLEHFEIDNSEYAATGRYLNVGGATSGNERPAAGMTKPFPLQLFTFQISQPGENYQTLFTNTSLMGIRGSTLRTFADFNLQAAHYRKTNTSYNPAPYFMRMANQVGYLPFDNSGATGQKFTENLTSSAVPWGRDSLSGSQRSILFSPPDANEMLVSLAQFQHADLTGDNLYASVAHQPGNAVGNSYASPFVLRQSVVQSRSDYRIVDYNIATATPTNFYDLSYLLNAALWDRYYFSTIPASGTPTPVNEKIIKISGKDESTDLRDPSQAAARLLVNGAFNINSTNKDAWKAFLGGTKHLKHPADTASSSDALFARSLRQTSPSKPVPTGKGDDSFSGFRRLNDNELDALATEITKQVRLRGPFVSLSQFVNRGLVSLTANAQIGRSGALQSAIDQCVVGGTSAINIIPGGAKKSFSDVVPTLDKLSIQSEGSGTTPMADLPGTRASTFQPSADWPVNSLDLNPGSIGGIYADKPMFSNNALRVEQGFRSTGIPGWLTQADVLQVIGPSISARSDTFKIRAYGEALDGSGKVAARAWCEAVVQRTPGYVDAQNLASDRGASLNTVNTLFGRKFTMVSFRWLSSNEI